MKKKKEKCDHYFRAIYTPEEAHFTVDNIILYCSKCGEVFGYNADWELKPKLELELDEKIRKNKEKSFY